MTVIQGKFRITNQGSQSGFSVVQNDGTTNINAYARLTLDYNYLQNAGNLQTTGGGVAYLDSNVTMHGGNIWLGLGDLTQGATLNVNGTFLMDGGYYKVAIDATALWADRINVLSGGITLTGQAGLDVTTINVPPGGVPKNKRFAILDSVSSITGNFNPSNIIFDLSGVYTPSIRGDGAGGQEYDLNT